MDKIKAALDQLESIVNFEHWYMTEATATLTEAQQKLTQVQKQLDFLGCLEECGVDNWDGYSEAKRMMREADGLYKG